jgi:hypothetical protein
VFVEGRFPRQEHQNRLILTLHTCASLLSKNLLEAVVPKTGKEPAQVLCNSCRSEDGVTSGSQEKVSQGQQKMLLLLFNEGKGGNDRHKVDPMDLPVFLPTEKL